MLWRKCLFLVFFTIQRSHADYSCRMSGKNVSCTGAEETTLNKNLSVTLSNDDTSAIEELLLEDSSIVVVEEGAFVNFKNLQRIYLRNTRTRFIVEGAFANLINLKIVQITHNYLEGFNSDAFAPNSSIETLDLSHNLLRDLTGFDINQFPSISIMNVSHNRLEYLPGSLLDKLEEVNDFYLIVDNNPWNCSHSSWVDRLTDTLVAAFCTNNVYDSREVEDKVQTLENLLFQNFTKEVNECYIKCAFLSCLWWIFGATWFGIIAGNIFKIKSLLFTTPKTYVDKNTQCDQLEVLRKV